MKLITNYNEYIVEQLILEAMRELKFVLSPRLIEVLGKINHEISDELLKCHNDLDFNYKQTFIDVDDTQDESVTFIQANKAAEILNITENDLLTNPKLSSILKNNIRPDSEVYKNQRGNMRIGRLVTTLFPNKFPSSERSGSNTKPKDVESFVRLYKSLSNQDVKFQLFDVVHGYTISHFYNYRQYQTQNGTLGSSCMSHVDSSYFDIYCRTPEVVGLVVLYTNLSKNKIKGRALLWSLIEPEGRFFTDRIYTNDSSDEQLFIDFAKKNEWYRKQYQSMGANCQITDTRNNNTSSLKMVSQLSPIDHDKYPYVDTMCFYNPDNGLVSNRQQGMLYSMMSTDGDHGTFQVQQLVHSNYHNDDIPRDQVRMCQIGNDWVRTNEAVRVYNAHPTDRVYAVPNHPDVVVCNIQGVTNHPKHFLKSRSVYSDFLNTWVFEDSVRKVWMDKDCTVEVIDHKKREGTNFVKVGRKYFAIDLCEKDASEHWILK